MKVCTLLEVLGADRGIEASDDVFVLSKNKLVIARGPLVVAEIDTAKGVLNKGVGLVIRDADSCAAPKEGAVQ